MCKTVLRKERDQQGPSGSAPHSAVPDRPTNRTEPSILLKTKKTLIAAALGASALTAGLVLGGAAPAMADPGTVVITFANVQLDRADAWASTTKGNLTHQSYARHGNQKALSGWGTYSEAWARNGAWTWDGEAWNRF